MERSSLEYNSGLCKGSNHIGCGCEFGKVYHKGILGSILCQLSYRSHLDIHSLFSTVLGIQIVPICL